MGDRASTRYLSCSQCGKTMKTSMTDDEHDRCRDVVCGGCSSYSEMMRYHGRLARDNYASKPTNWDGKCPVCGASYH